MVRIVLYGASRAGNWIMFPRLFRLASRVARRPRGNDAALEFSSRRIVKPLQEGKKRRPVLLSGVMPLVLIAAASAVLPCLCQAQGYLITTVAGGGVPFTPAPATSISLAAGSVAAGAHGDAYFIAFDCVFKMDATGIVTRVAGTSQGYSGDGGPALNAQLNYPFGVAVDGSGNVFIADTGNFVVREVAAATGIITTVAGIKVPGGGNPISSGDGGSAARAGLSDPTAVAVDGFGNLYIADNYLVRKVAAATGIITTVAGDGDFGYSGDGGPATAAGLGGVVTGIAVDGSGNFYILSSYSNAARKVSAATGIITTVAGNGTAGYSGDGGSATSAQLDATGLAVDGSGDIYIADNKDNVIRKVSAATGIIATVAGNGGAGYSGDGGPAISAKLNQPYAVAVDGPGNIYIADTGNNVIRKVAAATGIITTVAGNGAAYQSGDGGPATNAQFVYPLGVAVDGSGNLYISDLTNVVRKVTAATGIITTVAGNGAAGYSGDGGPAIKARLNHASSMSVDSSGNLYIADTGNDVIRKVSVATGIITTVAGTGTRGYSGDGGPASSAELSGPLGVAVDGTGNLYIGDTGNAVIRKVAAATGTITTVAGDGAFGYSGDGGPAIKAKLGGPWGVAVDGAGNLYIADTQNNAIRKVVAATGIITTVAGNGSTGFSGDGGPATSAELYNPMSVAVDGSGNLYLVDWYYGRLRKVAATGTISTVAGNLAEGSGYSGDGGPAISAQLRLPSDVALDGSGDIYVADAGNARVRLLVPEVTHALLSVTKTHTGNFTLGQTGATYSVVVSNAASAGPTKGTVTVSENVPPGLALQSMSGTGWSCTSSPATCTRSDALNGGSSYPLLTVAVNVTGAGVTQAINEVTLTGAEGIAPTADDPTNIVALPPAIAPLATVSAASGAAPVTADSIVSMYAADIATGFVGATAGPPAPLPVELGGVSATITDSFGRTAPIPLIVVTQSQVNAVLPGGLSTGEATINLVSSTGAAITGDVSVVTVAPSLFTADESGHGIAAAQEVIAHQNGSQTFISAVASCTSIGCTPTPISLGSSTDEAVLILFGTGIRGAGGTANVSVVLGNTEGTVMYAGAQGGGSPDSYYGLDQVNVLLPRSLAGAGTVNVVLTAGGQTANTVTVDIQ